MILETSRVFQGEKTGWQSVSRRKSKFSKFEDGILVQPMSGKMETPPSRCILHLFAVSRYLQQESIGSYKVTHPSGSRKVHGRNGSRGNAESKNSSEFMWILVNRGECIGDLTFHSSWLSEIQWTWLHWCPCWRISSDPTRCDCVCVCVFFF